MVESLDAVPLVTVVDVISMVGGVLSYVQVNGVAAVFPLPARSVKLSAATFTVHKPSAVGVNIAVYTRWLLDVKIDNVPLVTVMSSTVKSVVRSDEVNVRTMGETLVTVPLETLRDVIVIVGGKVSTTITVRVAVSVLPRPIVLLAVYVIVYLPKVFTSRVSLVKTFIGVFTLSIAVAPASVYGVVLSWYTSSSPTNVIVIVALYGPIEPSLLMLSFILFNNVAPVSISILVECGNFTNNSSLS